MPRVGVLLEHDGAADDDLGFTNRALRLSVAPLHQSASRSEDKRAAETRERRRTLGLSGLTGTPFEVVATFVPAASFFLASWLRSCIDGIEEVSPTASELAEKDSD